MINLGQSRSRRDPRGVTPYRPRAHKVMERASVTRMPVSAVSRRHRRTYV